MMIQMIVVQMMVMMTTITVNMVMAIGFCICYCSPQRDCHGSGDTVLRIEKRRRTIGGVSPVGMVPKYTLTACL